jgi:hypothetical protein
MCFQAWSVLSKFSFSLNRICTDRAYTGHQIAVELFTEGECAMSRYAPYLGSTTLTTIFVGLEAAASALHLTSDELSAGFWGGKTLDQLADDKGIDVAVVQQAVQEAVKTKPRAAIQQAVVNGTLTQDNADWLLQGLEKNYWGVGKFFNTSFSLGRNGMSALNSSALIGSMSGSSQFGF